TSRLGTTPTLATAFTALGPSAHWCRPPLVLAALTPPGTPALSARTTRGHGRCPRRYRLRASNTRRLMHPPPPRPSLGARPDAQPCQRVRRGGPDLSGPRRCPAGRRRPDLRRPRRAYRLRRRLAHCERRPPR